MQQHAPTNACMHRRCHARECMDIAMSTHGQVIHACICMSYPRECACMHGHPRMSAYACMHAWASLHERACIQGWILLAYTRKGSVMCMYTHGRRHAHIYAHLAMHVHA
eukprot:349646-Chlamydomonas_euryale.AAC.5